MVRISQSSAYLLQNVVEQPAGSGQHRPTVVHHGRWDIVVGAVDPLRRQSLRTVGVESVSLSAAPDGTLLAVCAGGGGAGSQGKSALRSSNGGVTWTVQSSCLIGSPATAPGTSCETLTSGYLGGIDAVSPDTMFLYGWRSSLLVSHDGGALWQAVQPLTVYTRAGFEQAIFFNASDGVVLGEGGDTNEAVTLWSTNDGGTKWTSVLPQTN